MWMRVDGAANWKGPYDREPHHATAVFDGARGFGCGCRDVSDIRACAAELSQPSGSVRAAFRRRRRRRHHRPPRGGEARRQLGQRFVVENQPGPGGIAAARAVLSQAPDGYTIGLVTNGTSISAAIYKALPFDPVKEFATISSIGAFDLVFATNVESELKTFD